MDERTIILLMEMREELRRIRVLLDERLPPAGRVPAPVDRGGGGLGQRAASQEEIRARVRESGAR
jgi:hypothetical protein